MVLSFPSSVLDAAGKQLHDWEIPRGTPRQTIEKLKDHLHHDAIDYGVEQAILEGTRMRLLDQRGCNRQFNCAELGVNMLALFLAHGHDAKILRYRPDVDADHLAVYLPKEQLIFDPLYHMAGPVKLVKGGVYAPAGTSGLVDEHASKLYKSEWDLMNEEDILRQVNFMNSPLGFFAYYQDKQRIKSIEAGMQTIECGVLIGDDDSLILRFTGSDDLLEAYTFQRAYWLEEDILRSRDKHFLHLGVKWVEPTDLVYEEIDGDAHMLQPHDRYKNNVWGFSVFADVMRSAEWKTIMNEEVRKIIDVMVGISARAEAGDRSDPQTRVDYDFYVQKLFPYMSDMDEIDMHHYVMALSFADLIRARQIKDDRPRGRFFETSLENMKVYANSRKTHFGQQVDAFLKSEVSRKLLDEYQEMYRLREHVQLKFAS